MSDELKASCFQLITHRSSLITHHFFMKKVGFISLGCPKNLVYSEVMMGQLKAKGYEITGDASEAETLVVNTCGFIDAAKKESIEAILGAARLKSEGTDGRLVVAGCLSET